jgi:hypothetical protein
MKELPGIKTAKAAGNSIQTANLFSSCHFCKFCFNTDQVRPDRHAYLKHQILPFY